MLPPPIRYPLPTLAALGLAALLAWKGAEWSSGWRARAAAWVDRAIHGPPVPESTDPLVVAGPITRRALLLAEGTFAAKRPGSEQGETLERRTFLDVYAFWGRSGDPTHAKVGNRQPFGWVRLPEVLLWDTRLVLRPPGGKLPLRPSPGAAPEVVEVGRVPVPVLSGPGPFVRVATWVPAKPWAAVAREGFVRVDDLPPEAWGTLVGLDEMPSLTIGALGEGPGLVRLRALLGRLLDARPLTAADLEAARPALPEAALAGLPGRQAAALRIAEANARPEVDASWSGLSFRFVPLSDLP